MRLSLVLAAALLALGAAAAPGPAGAAEPALLPETSDTQFTALPLPPGTAVYRNDAPKGRLEDLRQLATTKIVPALPGALFLLGLSLLFSTINFYTELRRRQRDLHQAFRYLLVWSFVNYVFALLFLTLIVPDEVSLASVNRTLLMYCLVATALPELSANIRLQLGRSDQRALDLYKYKMKVSDLIARRMDRASSRAQSADRAFLEAHYESRPEEFVRRFRIFLQTGRLSEAEQIYL